MDFLDELRNVQKPTKLGLEWVIEQKEIAIDTAISRYYNNLKKCILARARETDSSTLTGRYSIDVDTIGSQAYSSEFVSDGETRNNKAIEIYAYQNFKNEVDLRHLISDRYIVSSDDLGHLLDHLTADAACLTGSQIAVIAILKIYTDLACSLHLELLHCCLCFGNHSLIACHTFNLLF